MHFNTHSALQGRHAILSPSYYHWVNYDDQKLEARFHTFTSAKRGTDLHELAHMAIVLGVPLALENGAIAHFVNDVIAIGGRSEQPLFYSENCFGTADAIQFDGSLLSIYDLKNGINKTSPKQLEVYGGIFCLEYVHDPEDLEFDLRIYQGDGMTQYSPDPLVIRAIMDKIVQSDLYLEELKERNSW